MSRGVDHKSSVMETRIIHNLCPISKILFVNKQAKINNEQLIAEDEKLLDSASSSFLHLNTQLSTPVTATLTSFFNFAT